MCNAIDKIVVVDNCSTDYSLSKLTCLKSDKIDVIQTDKMVDMHMETILDADMLKKL